MAKKKGGSARQKAKFKKCAKKTKGVSSRSKRASIMKTCLRK